MSQVEPVGVLGASSIVGDCLLQQLTRSGRPVIAFSRQAVTARQPSVDWRLLDSSAASDDAEPIANWVSIAPIWVLPDYFETLGSLGVKRLVVLSSTSRFSKIDSPQKSERQVARLLIDGESRLRQWAEARDIEWVILRPTLIYGLGSDNNISNMVHFIRRWGFFPVIGKARGLRQPVHADDVAGACYSVLTSDSVRNRDFNISGAEVLEYSKLVKRIFVKLGRKPRLLAVPRWGFRLALTAMRLLPRYRGWSVAMADRMESDLVFAHDEATRAFKFSPRPFHLDENDIPRGRNS